MHPMFKELFIDTDADDLTAGHDRWHRVRRSRRARLAGRLTADGVSAHALDELAQTVRRVVSKLLHAPTVRVKELAGSARGKEYAAALRVLFDLDPRTVEAVTRTASARSRNGCAMIPRTEGSKSASSSTASSSRDS